MLQLILTRQSFSLSIHILSKHSTPLCHFWADILSCLSNVPMHVTQMQYVPTEMIHTTAFISEDIQEMGKFAPVYNQSLQIAFILGSWHTFGKLFNL